MATNDSPLRSITCAQIGAAFLRSGYKGMTPVRAQFLRARPNANGVFQVVYVCTWEDSGYGAVHGNAYLTFDDSGNMSAET